METSIGVSEFDNERMKELKAFDNTKLGVQGLVDAGVVHIPKIFVRSKEELAEDDQYYSLDLPKSHNGIPVIDLDGLSISEDCRKKIVEEVRIASEKWGFFKVVHHGVPVEVLDNMIAGVKRFNEQDIDEKKEFYSRDLTRRVRFNSNHNLFESKRADWRDTLTVSMLDSDHIDPNELPRT